MVAFTNSAVTNGSAAFQYIYFALLRLLSGNPSRDLIAAAVVFYPNPATEEAWAVGNLPSGTEVQVVDFTGRVIFFDSCLNSEQAYFNLKLDSWPSGIYTVSLDGPTAVCRPEDREASLVTSCQRMPSHCSRFYIFQQLFGRGCFWRGGNKEGLPLPPAPYQVVSTHQNSKFIMKKICFFPIMVCLSICYGQWTTTSLSEAKEGMGAAALPQSDTFWFAGGWGDIDETNKVEIFDA